MQDKKIYIKKQLIGLGPTAIGNGRKSAPGYKACYGAIDFQGSTKKECIKSAIDFFRSKRGIPRWDESFEMPPQSGFAEDDDFILPEEILDRDLDAEIDWDLVLSSNQNSEI